MQLLLVCLLQVIVTSGPGTRAQTGGKRVVRVDCLDDDAGGNGGDDGDENDDDGVALRDNNDDDDRFDDDDYDDDVRFNK